MKFCIKERNKAERLNETLRERLANFRVPHVQEYVQRKANLRELRKTVRSWERKVDIVQVSKRKIICQLIPRFHAPFWLSHILALFIYYTSIPDAMGQKNNK